MLLSGYGCSDIDFDVPESSRLNEYPVILHVSDAEETKIINNQSILTWEQDDHIQLTAVTDGLEQKDTVAVTELQCFAIDGSNPSKASFSGFVSLRNAPRDCYFTYPSGAAMTIDPSTGFIRANYTQQDGSHKPFLYAKTAYPENPEAGVSMTMSHIGAVLEIDVQIQDIASISFVGNELEKLSPISINPDDHSLVMPNEAVTQITVPVQNEGKTYLFVPPVNLSKGFSLICSKSDGSYFIKSYSSGNDDGYDFSDKQGVKIPVQITGEFNQFSITVTDPKVEHTTSKEGLLTGSLASFTINLNGSSNKLIEAWGADLLNSEGEIVRSVSLSDTRIPNGRVEMNDEYDLPLLEAGKYTLAPYYKMYGKTVSLNNQLIDVQDPGVIFTVEGVTSYDKYLSRNLDGDNGANNTSKRLNIENVRVTTNVDHNIMSDYEVTLGGTPLGDPTSLTTKDGVIVAEYGTHTRSTYGNYPIVASFNVGNKTFSKSKNCHITGLPFDINFQTSSLHNGWTHSNVAIEASHYRFPEGTSSIISPKFHIPDDTKVGVSLTAYAYVGWCLWGTKATVNAYIDVTDSAAKQSGVSKSFTGSDSTNPSNQSGEQMTGNLTFTDSANKISISTVNSKNSSMTGVISFGLYAKNFTIRYK